MDNSRLVDIDSTACSNNRLGGVGGDTSHLAVTPAESTRLSSVHQNSTGKCFKSIKITFPGQSEFSQEMTKKVR